MNTNTSYLNNKMFNDDNSLQFPKETYLRWWKDMLLIRKFEEKVGQLYIQQKFGGFCHLYIGQEAIVVGTASACKPGDKHITAYRDHAHPIALGTDPKILMAELYGRTTGCSKGKGGSMHFFDKKVNFMGGHGIVGAQIAMGAGIAFAEKYNNTTNVVYVSMGDGAVRQGALHETFNMAMLWKLPAVFIIENNNYAMGTSVERTTNVPELKKIGDSYLMPSITVDGMKPETVHKAIQNAAQHARQGNGPILLDIQTYRYKGHSMSDPQKYRTKQEVQQWQNTDPIIHCIEIIKENNWLTQDQIEETNKWVKTTVEECVKFAEESPYPEGKEIYQDVYKEDNYPFIVEY